MEFLQNQAEICIMPSEKLLWGDYWDCCISKYMKRKHEYSESEQANEDNFLQSFPREIKKVEIDYFSNELWRKLYIYSKGEAKETG